MAIQRRGLVMGGMVLGTTIGILAARPSDKGGPHSPYFQQLSQALAPLPAMPTLVIDKKRLQENLGHIRRIAHTALPLRIVVKSLPCLKLIDHAMSAWKTDRLMVFNAQQWLSVVTAYPKADILFGKPLPASAALWALQQAPQVPAAHHTQWLVDTPERLTQYRDLARAQKRNLSISIEIDVGLHRGGVEVDATLVSMLDIIRTEPLLSFAGLMGYEAHLAAIPDIAGNRDQALEHALSQYKRMLEICKQHLQVDNQRWTLNTAGSPTFHLHNDQHAPNELSVGTAAVKPSDFDKPSLEALQPAAFIATPVIKTMDTFRLPYGAQTISSIARWWDVNQSKAIAIHGGHWLADPVSPSGIEASSLYGESSNQQVLVASATAQAQVDDWLFLRPRQSEAVFTQFGAIAVIDNGAITEQWPVFAPSA